MKRCVTRTTTLTSLHCTDHDHSSNITFPLECLDNEREPCSARHRHAHAPGVLRRGEGEGDATGADQARGLQVVCFPLVHLTMVQRKSPCVSRMPSLLVECGTSLPKRAVGVRRSTTDPSPLIPRTCRVKC